MPGGGTLAGHMAAAGRKLGQLARGVDVVWEVVDARAPFSTRNVHLTRNLGGRPVWLLLAKRDLARDDATQAWLTHFRDNGQPAVALRAAGDHADLAPLRGLVRRRAATGGTSRGAASGRPLRALIVGIPNVGKSTLINRLAGRAKADTGARPGITRGEQWLHLDGFELLDTPGILPPYLGGGERSAKLRAIDCLNDSQFPADEAALWLVHHLQSTAPRTLEAAYDLADERGAALDVLEALGRRRGALAAGGGVDLDRAAHILLADFRRGRLGAQTLEWPS